MNDRIVPVDVVELDLNELHFRVLVEDLYKELRCAVIGETEVPDLAFCLLLDSPIEAVVLLVDLIVVSILNAVEEIEIEEVNAASVKLLIEELVPILQGMYEPRRKLCSERERISRMTLNDGFLYCLLGVAAVIYICGIEISKTCFQIAVRHL